jgi:hypothetical protein
MTAGAKYFQQRNQKMLGRRPVICSTQSQNLHSRGKETSREKQGSSSVYLAREIIKVDRKHDSYLLKFKNCSLTCNLNI